MKTFVWAIRHPIFAFCWFRFGLPFSRVEKLADDYLKGLGLRRKALGLVGPLNPAP